jgi:hypothetical protein
MIPKLPSKVQLAGLSPDLRRTINQLIDYVQSITPVSTPGVRIDRTGGGTFIKPTGRGSSGGRADDTWY